MHVEIHFDIVARNWEIWLDYSSAYSGPVATDGRLWQIRLAQRGRNEANGVAADNFTLNGGLPGAAIDDDSFVSSLVPGWTLSPYPNPANDVATIRWETTRPLSVRIEIVDISGRRVWTDRIADQQVGIHTVTWDGLDRAGRPLSAGTYFVRVISGNRQLGCEKILLRR